MPSCAGQEYHFRLTKEAHAQARQLFEKAIALDPQYAEAYACAGLHLLDRADLGLECGPSDPGANV